MLLTEELLSLGLNNKEAEVYLAALQLGYASVRGIADRSHINRTTAYTYIKNLIGRGLIKAVEKYGHIYYVAEGPERLRSMYEQEAQAVQRKRDLLDKILPELESIYSLAKERPFVRYYTHKDNLSRIRTEIAELRADEMYNIFNYSRHSEYINRNHIQNVLDSVERFNAIYIAQNKVLDKRLMDFQDNEKFKIRYLPLEKFSFPCEILIAGPRVYIAKDEDALLINDKLFAQTFIILFHSLWSLAEKF